MRELRTCRLLDSQAGHARTHADETGHPVIYADPHGGGFTWCYPHNRYL